MRATHGIALFLSLLAPAFVLGCTGADDADMESTGEVPGDASATPGAITVSGDFATPESVLHDEAADVYLVSNIDGDPTATDGNGFISRVSPEGEVLELRWIDGSAGEFTLNAPKGMAILGDTLYVADIDCVRMFHRETAAAAGEVCFPEATFLNDVAVDRNNVLHVTDTGVGPGFEDTGADAVYMFAPDGNFDRLVGGEELGRPNGIDFGPRGGLIATFGTGEIYILNQDGSRTTVLPPGERQLDGIVYTPDGGFLFSSWANQAVVRVAPDGQVTPIVEGVEAPADIGYDATRDRVLIPLFNDNQVLIHPVGTAGEAGAGGDTATEGGDAPAGD